MGCWSISLRRWRSVWPVPAAGLRTRAASDGCRTRKARFGSAARAVIGRADRSGWPQCPARRPGGPERARRLSAAMRSMIARTRADRPRRRRCLASRRPDAKLTTGGYSPASSWAIQPAQRRSHPLLHPADQRSVTRRSQCPASIRSMIATPEQLATSDVQQTDALAVSSGSVVTNTTPCPSPQQKDQ